MTISTIPIDTQERSVKGVKTCEVLEVGELMYDLATQTCFVKWLPNDGAQNQWPNLCVHDMVELEDIPEAPHLKIMRSATSNW